MMPSPRITVVTATYNYPSVLKLAIETVLEQTYSDFEYLIIGDGCTDETEMVVQSFADERIRWMNLPENLGNQSDVNKIALEMAKGELIAYLNHDDLWFPDHLESLVDCIDNGGFDIAASLCISMGPPPSYHRYVVGLPNVSRDWSMFRVQSMTSTVLHTKEIAKRAGGWANWRELENVPTNDFFDRIRAVSSGHAVVPLVTCLKFHSALRRNSYVTKDASEHLYWRKRMLAEPDLRHRELAVAMALEHAKVFRPDVKLPEKPVDAKPGWKIEHWRRARGLEPMVDLGDAGPELQEFERCEPDERAPVRLGQSGQLWICPSDN